MRAALAITANDLRRRLRDRSALLVAFVLPLALAGIFSLTLANATDDDVTFSYALVDQDRGPAADAFREALAQIDVVDLTEDRDEAAATFVLSRGFSAAVTAGRPARLEVIGDVDAPIGTLVARAIAEQYAGEFRAIGISLAAAHGTADPAALVERAARVPSPVALEDVTATRKELDPKTFYAA